MNERLLAHLEKMFLDSPIMRARDTPSLKEIETASQAIGVPFAADYRDFLLRYGGATVGAFPIYGLRPVEVLDARRWSVVDVTKSFRAAGLDHAMHWVIFSEDHAGNPIGMDADGVVWVYDHDFGGTTKAASDFANYLFRHCLKIPRGL